MVNVSQLPTKSALVESVTVRWIPSEINVSDRPSRIHDPSEIRDKTLASLLTTAVKEKTHVTR